MKKAMALAVSVLTASAFLTGCANKSNNGNSAASASSSKQAASSIEAASSKNKASSESLAKAKSASEAKKKQNQSSEAQSDSTSQATNNTTTTPDFSLDIHAFVNKYGMTEAAYRSTYMGMSSKEALYATPDSHESSGEIQSENLFKQGKDPYADTSSNSDTNSSEDTTNYDSDYYNDDSDYVEYPNGAQKAVSGKNDDWYTEQYQKHHPEAQQ
ncbi:hypothetical protein [Loigolactobacillus bifermentans]|jgi:hypothetical protein|uniref:Lipoprotein n=1 Tax=Loigolactobacillus bifermentans DSM 20003 TaxID=1423726 RepID=A0A0R1GQH9_9LACO|nr:hypothetical protein [Loigolactobacillus bifermentans]KRK33159.1 hypothetical protein FC07_GL001413 [Loigolactobacillus bifermentans DSM 20003]QGG60510.1 hypothetical protein LB003_08560 [Loigolactobacillus bifermentans]